MVDVRSEFIALAKSVDADKFELESAEQSWLKTGDMRYVLQAIATCAVYDTVIPEWAAKAYLRGYRTITTRRAKSWDDVFGKPLKKRMRLGDARRRVELEPKVWVAVTKILKEEPSTPLDIVLFERVGDQLGIGKTLVSELWYHNRMPRLPR